MFFYSKQTIEECAKDRPDNIVRNDTHMHYRFTCEWVPLSYLDKILTQMP